MLEKYMYGRGGLARVFVSMHDNLAPLVYTLYAITRETTMTADTAKTKPIFGLICPKLEEIV